MKKLTIILFLLFTSSLLSQYSIPLRLVTSTGTPSTGKADSISFTRYPHSYPTNVVGSITVTEVGTAGNYVCKGFTTYEYVRLWISGVNQTWFDSVQVGNPKSYFGAFVGNNTWTGTNTFSNNVVFSTNVTNTAGEFRINKPLLYDSSPWYSDWTLLVGKSLIWKDYLTSNYVDTSKIYYDGSKLRLKTGYKLYGITNTVPPILLSSQFTWNETTGLGLNTGFGNDSTSTENFTIKKDTTWQVLGEDVTKFRSMTLKKPWWGQMLTNFNAPDWKWYYKSFNESGTVVASDSFAVINDYVSHDRTDIITLSSSYQELNSKEITHGVWSINMSIQYDFVDVSLGGGGGTDTAKFILVVSNMGDYDTLATFYTTENYIVGANIGRADVISWNYIYDGTGMVPGETRTLYVKVKEWANGSASHSRVMNRNLNAVLIR